MKENIVYVITGPTASGKSALAIEMANRLDTDVINADSRQIYRGMPIVTAVPTDDEREGVRHHLREVLDLDEYYSASMFEQQALEIAGKLLEEKGCAVVCGGSMMYVDTFCHGIDDLPTVPKQLRKDLEREWQDRGDDWLRGMLKSLDPAYWERVDLRNMKRVFHAVEISLTAGRAYSELLNKERRERDFRIVKIFLSGDRGRLFERINSRVDRMVEMGLEEEARRLYPLKGLNSLNTVGIKEMFAMFEGELPRETAFERIKKNTRVYAKKQITWFKRDENMLFLDFEAPRWRNVERALESVSS